MLTCYPTPKLQGVMFFTSISCLLLKTLSHHHDILKLSHVETAGRPFCLRRLVSLAITSVRIPHGSRVTIKQSDVAFGHIQGTKVRHSLLITLPVLNIKIA